MRVTRWMSVVLLFGVPLVPSALLADEDEISEARQAWRKRLDENVGVVYQASGVRRAWDAERRGQAALKDVNIGVLIRCDERKFRFDVQDKESGLAALHILDRNGFHTSVAAPQGQWHIDFGNSISENSDWLYLYPFLLAHGVVPLPPFESPQILAKKQSQAKDFPDQAGRQVKIAFEDAALSVTISHGTSGMIDRYDVAEDGRAILEIRNSYKEENGAVRLDGFSVVVFKPQVARTPLGRLDARVTACRLDASIPMAAFAPPREPEKLRTAILDMLDKTARVDVAMTLDEVAQAIQMAVGPSIQIRINSDGFKNQIEVKPDRLRFEPGEAKLSELLYQDFRKNHLDFHIDPQGVVLIPRKSAWAHADVVNYTAKDFGLSTGELRDLLYQAGTLDDWSDVGGNASMLVDGDVGIITVFHTQSDHLRFQERLKE